MKYKALTGAALLLVLAGCTSDNNPAAGSDSKYQYADGAVVPVDDAVYTITGEVVGQVNSLTRQIDPAKGSISGSQYGGYGTLTGSFTGPVEAGKGFVRLKISSSNPSTDIAPVNEVAIIKTSDTKATALMPGDIITVKCRRQYENIGAVKDNAVFDKDKVGTWELDYCRFATPVIQVK